MMSPEVLLGILNLLHCLLAYCVGQRDNKLIQELVAGSTKKVSAGKVRRKKDPTDKSKGFGAPAAVKK